MNPLIPHFQMMARYNRLANKRLYDCCAQLTDAERKKNRQAFFKSIHGTLNHIMVGDRNWMTRFEGGVASSAHLDAVLYDDFEELRAARIREDERIEGFAASLSDEFLDGEIAYVSNEGKSYRKPVQMLLAHLFNHETHHRGQVHAMLSQAGIATPVLDLPRVIVS
ncbi:MAG: DinB family protein [Candidatus Binataceae bacterium]